MGHIEKRKAHRIWVLLRKFSWHKRTIKEQSWLEQLCLRHLKLTKNQVCYLIHLSKNQLWCNYSITNRKSNRKNCNKRHWNFWYLVSPRATLDLDMRFLKNDINKTYIKYELIMKYLNFLWNSIAIIVQRNP